MLSDRYRRTSKRLKINRYIEIIPGRKREGIELSESIRRAGTVTFAWFPHETQFQMDVPSDFHHLQRHLLAVLHSAHLNWSWRCRPPSLFTHTLVSGMSGKGVCKKEEAATRIKHSLFQIIVVGRPFHCFSSGFPFPPFLLRPPFSKSVHKQCWFICTLEINSFFHVLYDSIAASQLNNNI